MKPNVSEAIKTWIAHDLPPIEAQAMTPALLDALKHRIDGDPEVEPPKPKPAPPPEPPKPSPSPAAKKKAAIKVPKVSAKNTPGWQRFIKAKPKARKSK